MRPDCLPAAASRAPRVWVARGSIPYSAVTQPEPLPLRKPGTFSSTLAVHSTRVSPNSTSTEPSAWRVKPRVMRTGRSWSAGRSSNRGMAGAFVRVASGEPCLIASWISAMAFSISSSVTSSRGDGAVQVRGVRRRGELLGGHLLGVGVARVVLRLPGHRDHRQVVALAAGALVRLREEPRQEAHDVLLAQQRGDEGGRDLAPEAVRGKEDRVARLQRELAAHGDHRGHDATQAAVDLVALGVHGRRLRPR